MVDREPGAATGERGDGGEKDREDGAEKGVKWSRLMNKAKLLYFNP